MRIWPPVRMLDRSLTFFTFLRAPLSRSFHLSPRFVVALVFSFDPPRVTCLRSRDSADARASRSTGRDPSADPPQLTRSLARVPVWLFRLPADRRTAADDH